MSRIYPGGKNTNGAYHTIINCFPPHVIFIELFGGSGAIIKHKKPAKYNLLIEIDRAVIDKFHSKGKVKYQVLGLDAFTLMLPKERPWIKKNTLIYCDPPYIKSSRRSQRDIYKFEWTDEQHKNFLSWAVKSKAMIVISAYQNPLYDAMLKGWRRIEYKAGLQNGGTAIESLYINFPVPAELHEYTYLGADCWERQYIKRTRRNIINKLKRLPAYERQAIISEVNTKLNVMANSGP